MFSSQSAFAGLCFNNGECDNAGQDLDGNPCTDVVQCVGETMNEFPIPDTPGACAQPPNSAPCDDDDNNICTTGLCLATVCVPNPNTVSCDDDDGNVCTFGQCIASACLSIPVFGAPCGDAGTQCTNQDTCTAIGACSDKGFVSSGTSCGSGSDTQCTNPDTCNGAGSCQSNNAAPGTACGNPDDTECSNSDTCFGGTCLPNDEAPGTICDADGDQCTGPDTCDSAATCIVGQEIDDIPGCFPVVGGTIIPIESTSLLLAGAQTFSWMIPVVVSGIGIGLFLVRRK